MSSQSARRWKRYSGEAIAVLALAAVTLLACRTAGPVRAGLGVEVSQEALLSLLADRHRAVSSIKALVDVQGARGRGSFMGILQMRPPEDIRFQGVDSLGRTAFDFISRGEEFELYLPARREVIKGRLDALDREAGPAVSVPLPDLLAAVSALVSPFVDVEEVTALERRDGAYLLNVFLAEPSTRQSTRLLRRLWFEGERLVLIREEVFGPSGASRATFTLEDFRLLDGEWRPHRLILARGAAPAADARPVPVLTVGIRELQVNPRLDPEAFTFGSIPGVAVREAGEER